MQPWTFCLHFFQAELRQDESAARLLNTSTFASLPTNGLAFVTAVFPLQRAAFQAAAPALWYYLYVYFLGLQPHKPCCWVAGFLSFFLRNGSQEPEEIGSPGVVLAFRFFWLHFFFFFCGIVEKDWTESATKALFRTPLEVLSHEVILARGRRSALLRVTVTRACQRDAVERREGSHKHHSCETAGCGLRVCWRSSKIHFTNRKPRIPTSTLTPMFFFLPYIL